VDVVQIKPWIPAGLAEANQEELSLRPEPLAEVFTRLAGDLLDRPGPELTASCYPPTRNMGFGTKDCANVAKIYCAPDSQALVCKYAAEHLGSWHLDEGGLLARPVFFTRALTTTKVIPVQFTADKAAVYLNIVNELAPGAWHRREVPGADTPTVQRAWRRSRRRTNDRLRRAGRVVPRRSVMG